MSDFRITIEDGNANLFTPYNADYVKRIKLMGGKWNPCSKCWTIPEAVVDDARKIMVDIYGRDDREVGETADVELTFIEDCSEFGGPVTLLGRTIAVARGRDSGARVGDNVVFMEGEPTSGGSMKNWRTTIPAGCVVKLFKVPKPMLDNPGFTPGTRIAMRILSENIDRNNLEAEKARLLERLAEINKALGVEA